MPGTDPAEAITVALGELPGFPFLPELPARGPGADLIGRTAALLVDMPAETTAGGWRLAERPGRDLRRAAGYLAADLDAAYEAAAGFGGPVKIAVCGPWTLAATLELTRSIDPVLTDEGAVRDLAASLAEGVAAYAAEVRARLPAATIVVQVDEPALPGVLAGSVPTASGLYRVPPPDETDLAAHLRAVLAAPRAPAVVHCCAREVPFELITRAAATAVSFDLSLLRRNQEEALGEAVEAGVGLLVGAVPALPQADPPGKDEGARDTALRVIRMWRQIGLPADQLPAQVVITPACGLAGASPSGARAVLARCRTAGQLIAELIEEGAA